MRILLINPRYPPSFWSLSGATQVTGRPGLVTPTALATIAALTPDDIEVEIVDESVEPLDLDTPCDLVGITGYVTQKDRMHEIATAFRARGVPVAIGGPYASLSPHVMRPYADILFRGEAEETWPAFVEDFRRGEWKDEYHQVGNVDVSSSPAPRVDAVNNDRYFMGAVQTSRGCPFECEFCDVIVYLGRRQRYKEPDQVVAELERFHQAGYRLVFLADDNLTAHRGRSAKTMQAIADWNATKTERMAFNTQISVDAARDGDEDLLALCAEAGLSIAFVGVETPDTEALLEVNKHQNVRYDLLSHLRRFHEHGIIVQAGMIVGFDADRTDIFVRQFDFAQEAGTAMTSLTTLNAPEGTALEKRLKEQGRLREGLIDDAFTSSNIVPLHMTTDELRAGTRWLMNKLYMPDAFLERLSVAASCFPDGPSRRPMGREGAEMWDRLTRAYRQLGPDFERMPRLASGMFRGKDMTPLGTALIFYLHVVKLLRHWDVWDPDLASHPEPVW